MTRDPKEILFEISANRDAVAYCDEQLAPLLTQKKTLDGHDAALRIELRESLDAADIRSIRESGLVATVRELNGIKVENEAEVTAALIEIGRLAECQRVSLDVMAVKRISTALPELLPGTVATCTRYVEVRAG